MTEIMLMRGTPSIALALAVGICLATLSCGSSADRSDTPEAVPAAPAEAGAYEQAAAVAVPGGTGGTMFQPSGDGETQAREVRAFLDEVRPLAASCTGNVTIRSLVIIGSGPDAQVMRLPPTPRPCEALTAEIQLWESRLSTIEAGD